MDKIHPKLDDWKLKQKEKKKQTNKQKTTLMFPIRFQFPLIKLFAHS